MHNMMLHVPVQALTIREFTPHNGLVTIDGLQHWTLEELADGTERRTQGRAEAITLAIIVSTPASPSVFKAKVELYRLETDGGTICSFRGMFQGHSVQGTWDYRTRSGEIRLI